MTTGRINQVDTHSYTACTQHARSIYENKSANIHSVRINAMASTAQFTATGDITYHSNSA